jgi:hypothetical protein
MTASEILSECINRNDAEGFLLEYLTLLIESKSLALPIGNTVNGVKLEWEDCIPVSLGEIPGEFLTRISIRWLEIVTVLGRRFYADYAKEALRIIKNQRAENIRLKELIRVGKHSVTEGGNPKLNRVIPTISSAYYKKSIVTSKTEINKNDSEGSMGKVV